MKTLLCWFEIGRGIPNLGHARGVRRAFTLVEIMIVVAIIGILSAIAVPAWAKSRNTARTKVCVTNLKQIFYAKAQWAFELHKGDAEIPILADVTPYLQNGTTPVCPAAGTYDLHSVAEAPTCSLSVDGHTL